MSDPTSPALLRFERAISTSEPDWDAALALLPELEKEGTAEEAQGRLRARRMPKGAHPPKLKQLKIRLGVAAEKARDRRAAGSRLDAERGILRLRYARGEAQAHLNPSQFLSLLTQTLRAAGLHPALSLERTPRPLVLLGHPLPLGLSGHSEWADAELSPMPAQPEEALVATLNAAAPPGLVFLGCAALPAFATPVLELSRSARWRWPCPAEWSGMAHQKLTEFESSATYFIDKAGKAGGQKVVKRVDVRPLAQTLTWEGDALLLTTRISAKDALNPLKLLAGILGLEPAAITGLTRLEVLLAEDSRLAQAERFELKLRNIYEDAVLLSAGPNLTLVEEDDEAPMQLG